MDAVADAAGKGGEKPPFYYAEEAQQNLFTCTACGAETDVLGRFGYCSGCGTRNDFDELKATIDAIHKRIESATDYEQCIKEAVSAFDSFASKYAEQLVARVPLTSTRRNRLDGELFHNLTRSVDLFKEIFGIDIAEGVASADLEFARIRFLRRHVYEHHGGEATEDYIRGSGENVRPKQRLHERGSRRTRSPTLSCDSAATSTRASTTSSHRSRSRLRTLRRGARRFESSRSDTRKPRKLTARWFDLGK